MKDVALMVVVPARGGSKRIPRKNLRPLGGRPLLAYTADALAQAGLTARTVLSTDDPEIADAGAALGWSVPFMRPASLSGDTAGTAETVLHAVDTAAPTMGGEPDIVLVLQPTSPFRSAAAIEAALALLAEDTAADGVVGVSRLHVAAHHVYREAANGALDRLAPDVTDGSAVLVPNGALYLIRTRSLRETRSFYSGRILPLEMAALPSLDIDSEEDFRMAEALLPLGRQHTGRTA